MTLGVEAATLEMTIIATSSCNNRPSSQLNKLSMQQQCLFQADNE